MKVIHDRANSKLYYIFDITAPTFTGGQANTFTLGKLRNSNKPVSSPDTFIAVEMVYWIGKIKKQKITFGNSPAFTLGGIRGLSTAVYPS